MYPLPANHKSGEGLHRLKADEINTIENMLNGLVIEMVLGQDYAEVVPPPGQDGSGWTFKIPAGSTLDTTGAIKYQVYQITDDTTTPPTAGFDWVRAHA